MERLSHDYKNIRNFLFGFLNKEFLIFLFFLALSAIFWLMMALNETYEREITVPMSLTNVPKNVVLTTEMDSTVKVTVRDKGFTLVTYMYSRRIRPEHMPTSRQDTDLFLRLIFRSLYISSLWARRR